MSLKTNSSLSEFYATVAIIVGLVTYALHIFNLQSIPSLIAVFLFGVALRLLAYYQKWHLPTLSK